MSYYLSYPVIGQQPFPSMRLPRPRPATGTPVDPSTLSADELFARIQNAMVNLPLAISNSFRLTFNRVSGADPRIRAMFDDRFPGGNVPMPPRVVIWSGHPSQLQGPRTADLVPPGRPMAPVTSIAITPATWEFVAFLVRNAARPNQWQGLGFEGANRPFVIFSDEGIR